MPGRKREDKRKANAEETPCATAGSPRAGLPDPKSVVAEEAFISPKGGKYRVLHTTERDGYDAAVPPPPAEPGRPPPKRSLRVNARPRAGDS